MLGCVLGEGTTVYMLRKKRKRRRRRKYHVYVCAEVDITESNNYSLSIH